MLPPLQEEHGHHWRPRFTRPAPAHACTAPHRLQPVLTSSQSMMARLLPIHEKSWVPKKRTGTALGRGGSSLGGNDRSLPRVSTFAGHQGYAPTLAHTSRPPGSVRGERGGASPSIAGAGAEPRSGTGTGVGMLCVAGASGAVLGW